MDSIRTLIIFFLMTLSSLSFGQNRVSFYGLRLGTDYKSCVKELKRQGYKIHVEKYCEDDMFYGKCKECFLTGEIDGNPAVVHITSSQVTHTVFSIEAILREFIDQEEAVEEADRLLPQIRDEHQFRKTEIEMPDISIVEMPGGKNRITKYMCYPVAGLRVRYYSGQETLANEISFGSVSIKVYQNSLDNEHIIVLDYYDMAIGVLAKSEAESNKTDL